MQLRKNSSSTAGKAVEGKGDLVALLRQTLLEEQLLTSDLKRKLQSTKKQNLALSQQLQEAKNQPGSPDPLPVSLTTELLYPYRTIIIIIPILK